MFKSEATASCGSRSSTQQRAERHRRLSWHPPASWGVVARSFLAHASRKMSGVGHGSQAMAALKPPGPLPENSARSDSGVGELPVRTWRTNARIFGGWPCDRSHARLARVNRAEVGGGQSRRKGGHPAGRGVNSAHLGSSLPCCVLLQGSTMPASSGRTAQGAGLAEWPEAPLPYRDFLPWVPKPGRAWPDRRS